MTKYTVTWHDRAQDQLARLWTDLPDRVGITRAADAIDAELKYDPDRQGTPEPDGLRSLYIPPLQVLFAVRELDRIVEVLVVRYLPDPTTGPAVNGHDQTNGSEI
jgi:hypothetical protein